MIASNPRADRTRLRRDPLREGVTLTEAVVSLFLFALFIACACELTVVTRQTSDRARFRYIAVNMAKSRLERVLTLEYDQVELCQVSDLVVDKNGSPDAEGDYRVSTTVTRTGPDVKTVRVKVDIRNRRSMGFDGESQALTSYLTPFGDPPDA
jgi:hypothetical protein